jgi:hypothetical protein
MTEIIFYLNSVEELEGHTITLKMKLPFTPEEFLQVFRNYNQSIFPLQVMFLFMALAVVLLLLKKIPASDSVINATLAFFWIWMGVVYDFKFFTTINKAAYAFGSILIAQGLLFIYFGEIRKKLTYQFHESPFKWIAAVLIAFALVLYPLLGYVFGHSYPAVPTFGLPCPTTIFTLAVLLCSDKNMPKLLLVIPFLWSIIGFSAAFQLGVSEDVGLIVAGITVTALLLLRRKSSSIPG